MPAEVRTCTCCGRRRIGCLPVNANRAVYCLDCRVLIARHMERPALTLITGGLTADEVPGAG